MKHQLLVTMGAAGSIVTNVQGEEKDITNPDIQPPTKAPSKTSQAPNMKTKFPTILPPSSPGQLIKKDRNTTTFKVTLAYKVPFIRALQPMKVYLLRVSLESLDILNEGEKKKISNGDSVSNIKCISLIDYKSNRQLQ